MSIILFKGVRQLMRADKACREAGLTVKVMPVPHTYSTECGMSLIVNNDDIDRLLKIVAKLEIEIEVK